MSFSESCGLALTFWFSLCIWLRSLHMNFSLTLARSFSVGYSPLMARSHNLDFSSALGFALEPWVAPLPYARSAYLGFLNATGSLCCLGLLHHRGSLSSLRLLRPCGSLKSYGLLYTFGSL